MMENEKGLGSCDNDYLRRVFMCSGILTAADFPSEVVIDGKGYKKDIKGPVNFAHAKHAGEYGAQCKIVIINM
jgi:hypothetical protein